MTPRALRITALGDSAVTVTLGHLIDEETRSLVRAASMRLDACAPDWIVDQVPAFVSVTVHYDPARVPLAGAELPHNRVKAELIELLSNLETEAPAVPRTVEIPVCYGGDLGPDLSDVAAQHGLSVDEIIRIHVEAEYVVHMVGFMPGFAYLGGLPERIVTPRRPSPRTAVPAGTVGIGGRQTGVYPLESPGGWNLIGRTPLRIFDIHRAQPTLLETGDRVYFRAIDRATFNAWPASP